MQKGAPVVCPTPRPSPSSLSENRWLLTVTSFPRLTEARTRFIPSPLPICQIKASAAWFLKGQSLACSSYQTVLRGPPGQREQLNRPAQLPRPGPPAATVPGTQPAHPGSSSCFPHPPHFQKYCDGSLVAFLWPKGLAVGSVRLDRLGTEFLIQRSSAGLMPTSQVGTGRDYLPQEGTLRFQSEEDSLSKLPCLS